MKSRFLYNSQKDCVNDSLQELDLNNQELCDLLNELNTDNVELESDNRYYRALYDMYERNYIDLKKGIDALIVRYNELSISDEDNSIIYSNIVRGLEDLFFNGERG